MSIAQEKFIAFTTYRESGQAVSTPVWVVPVSDGRIGFYTAMGSGKTLRLRNDPRVLVQPSDVRGRVDDTATSPVEGTAEMVQSGRLFDEVQAKVRAKYGFMTRVSKVINRLGRQGRQGLTYADTVVLVTLQP